MNLNVSRRLALALLLGLSLFPIACGSGARVHPVRGEVFVNGQPAAGAVVVLHPRDKEKGKPAYGTVQPDGSFKLSTYANHDGAAAGDYGVTVTWCDERREEGETIFSPDKLWDQFSAHESSGLTATVKAGKNDLPRFDLKVEQ